MTMIRSFGVTTTGEAVEAVTLRAGVLQATVLTYGAILQDVRLDGVAHGLTLGSEKLADYEGEMCYHGALVGPVVNRIRDAEAEIGGRLCQFEANQDGRHVLHCGAAGTHCKVWRLDAVEADRAVLSLDLPHGEGGFPGNRRVQVEFHVLAPATLVMTVSTETDAETLVNFANHSYWNLDGSETWAGHRLRIAADRWLPTDADCIPTGEIAPAEGTEMDFRATRAPLPGAPALDNNFCLSDQPVALRDVLWLTGRSAVEMVLATTEPGVQIYDGRNAIRPGHGPYEGLAIEAQLWPDAPGRAGFPPITLAAGERRVQQTRWQFGRGERREA